MQRPFHEPEHEPEQRGTGKEADGYGVSAKLLLKLPRFQKTCSNLRIIISCSPPLAHLAKPPCSPRETPDVLVPLDHS